MDTAGVGARMSLRPIIIVSRKIWSLSGGNTPKSFLEAVLFAEGFDSRPCDGSHNTEPTPLSYSRQPNRGKRLVKESLGTLLIVRHQHQVEDIVSVFLNVFDGSKEDRIFTDTSF